jgi:preprotein translocase subunit YajC
VGEALVFFLIGIGMVVILAFLANREQKKDGGSTDDYIKYTRQDVRMVVWLLAAVVVMLGIIADRIH